MNSPALIPKSFFRSYIFSISVILCLSLCSCFENEEGNTIQELKEAENEGKNKIMELEKELEILRWENSRLSLKLRSVDGAALVRDVQTNLWHFDVERTPYTGIATENFQDGRVRAEASFFNGKRDGMSRYWHANGTLKSEEQWFDGLEDGLFREWNEEKQLLRAVKYKRGELIEVLQY